MHAFQNTVLNLSTDGIPWAGGKTKLSAPHQKMAEKLSEITNV